jgi:hypothetical protein
MSTLLIQFSTSCQGSNLCIYKAFANRAAVRAEILRLLNDVANYYTIQSAAPQAMLAIQLCQAGYTPTLNAKFCEPIDVDGDEVTCTVDFLGDERGPGYVVEINLDCHISDSPKHRSNITNGSARFEKAITWVTEQEGEIAAYENFMVEEAQLADSI